MDLIHIRNLRVSTIIGINDWEQRQKQDVVINVTVRHDQRQAAATDRIEDTVNYKSLKDDIVTLVSEKQHALLETLAENVSVLCLSVSGVQGVHIIVDKPGALSSADSVAVEIDRP